MPIVKSLLTPLIVGTLSGVLAVGILLDLRQRIISNNDPHSALRKVERVIGFIKKFLIWTEWTLLRQTFTADWISPHKNYWEKFLQPFRDQPGIQALEIGCYEGRSTLWFLRNILTHPTSSITCIDIFRPLEARRFDRNISSAKVNHKVNKRQGMSYDILCKMEPVEFDFIYIDGNHQALDVYRDGIMSWPFLKVDGILIFDDYAINVFAPSHMRPMAGIDSFLTEFNSSLEILHKGYQVIIKKKRQTPLPA